jgi:hypothetical protein
MKEAELPQDQPGPSVPRDHERVNPLAAGILRRNGIKSWTKPAPSLYPHQWSWDSAFIALGLAHVDNHRATSELETLFESQWKTGKVPHIVFDPDAPPKSYFPDAERWNASGLSEHAPEGAHTSGLCQPPVHAIAVRRIWQTARGDKKREGRARAFLRSNYPRLLSWHRYLSTARDPEGSGLATIYHPWESGTDNSPRWDTALENVTVGDLPPYERLDLSHVEDPSERPTDEEYDRYLWLVELVKRARCDEAAIYDSHPFLVKDVLFSAILVAANEALLEIARVIGAPDEDRSVVERWIERGREGLMRQWDTDLGLCLDYDLRRNAPLVARTVAGFAPLVAGGLEPERIEKLLEGLYSRDFLGHPRLRRPLPPSASPDEPRFHPRSYWRGPVWPAVTWLLWRSLMRVEEETEKAEALRGFALKELRAGSFAEYFEPFTGEPLGSDDQSWTAAVVLDWLAYDGAG